MPNTAAWSRNWPAATTCSKLLPLIRQTLAEAGLTTADLDGVAYTAGPGLVGALLVGAGVARALAWALDVPAIGVHHMEGHLLAPLLEGSGPRRRPSWRCWSRAAYAAGRGGCDRPLPPARRNPGRCRRRGLRQDRQADGPAVPRRPAAGRWRRQGRPARSGSRDR